MSIHRAEGLLSLAEKVTDRRAAQSKGKNLSQEIILLCNRFCSHWSGATQAPAQKTTETKHSIPILQVGRAKAQKTLNHSKGCQHALVSEL